MNINFRVVGLDPGGTTGWFQFDAEKDALSKDLKFVEWKITPLQFGPHEHHGELYAALEHSHIHDYYLVYESFEFRQNKQRDNINLMSREYIGVAKLFAYERGLYHNGRVVSYTAGTSKGFIPDKRVGGLAANAKLRAMGWYFPGMKHSSDAARVAAYFMINRLGQKWLLESWKNL